MDRSLWRRMEPGEAASALRFRRYRSEEGHAAAPTMAAFQALDRRRELVPGILAPCYTFGRNSWLHAHVHLLATTGTLQAGGVADCQTRGGQKHGAEKDPES